MYKVATLNKISPVGLAELTDKYEIVENTDEANGIVVRSQDMKEMEFKDDLLCIARAGVGVNNINTEKCAEKGIVVFNTPGANANAVKEIVIAAALMASRNLVEGSNWASSLDTDIAKTVEKGKSQFKGNEIKGKTIGVIGLGGIGGMVANAFVQLGLNVIGYDAYLSVRNALHLSKHARVVERLEDMLPEVDFLTVHVHANDETKGMINAAILSQLKDGAIVLNYSRAAIVDDAAMKDALESGKVARYVTDFPEDNLKEMKNVIMTPHLGASTDEAEDNCAVMAVEEMMDYIEYGNITHSVNYPDVNMGRPCDPARIALLHKNVPTMISQITTTLKANISNMTNRSFKNHAYTLLDLDENVTEEELEALRNIQGIIRVRVIKN